MVGNTDAHRVEARGDEVAERRIPALGQHERQRTGPELRQSLDQRRHLDETFRHIQIGSVNDQRVEARPALDLVDLEHCVGIGRIGPEPVDGLGGEGDDLSRPQEGGKSLDLVVHGGSAHARCLTMPDAGVKKSSRGGF